MDLSEAVRLFEQFRGHVATGAERPHLERVRFWASWFREPDYSDDYRALFGTELCLNGGENYRKDYELLSIWRLARDHSYAKWAKQTGVSKCQISLFGMEEVTDWFYRRKGAFREAVAATLRLLDHGIVPRWQLFQTKKILPDLEEIVSLVDRLRLRERARSLGQEFVMFMHDPDPIGAARALEGLRITKDDLKRIPADLMSSTLDHMRLTDPYHTEGEWLSQIESEADGPIVGDPPGVLWLLVDSNWDVYPNLMSLEPWWKLGNLRRDSPQALVHKYLNDQTPGQRALRRESRRTLAARWGDPRSDRIYMSKQDLMDLYLEQDLERTDGKG